MGTVLLDTLYSSRYIIILWHSRDDGALVHDDVHVLVVVCPGLEVEHHAGVPVHHRALGQDRDVLHQSESSIVTANHSSVM